VTNADWCAHAAMKNETQATSVPADRGHEILPSENSAQWRM
jgi:hypothetical protein